VGEGVAADAQQRGPQGDGGADRDHPRGYVHVGVRRAGVAGPRRRRPHRGRSCSSLPRDAWIRYPDPRFPGTAHRSRSAQRSVTASAGRADHASHDRVRTTRSPGGFRRVGARHISRPRPAGLPHTPASHDRVPTTRSAAGSARDRSGPPAEPRQGVACPAGSAVDPRPPTVTERRRCPSATRPPSPTPSATPPPRTASRRGRRRLSRPAGRDRPTPGRAAPSSGSSRWRSWGAR